MSSTSSSSSPSDDDWDDWGASTNPNDAGVGAGDDDDAAVSLFDGRVLPSAAAALAHDAVEHGFDLAAFRSKLRLDDHDTFRVINYVRTEVAAGRDPRPALTAAAAGVAGDGAPPPPWSGDAFLTPVLPDDALLFHEFDEEAAGGEGGGAPPDEAAALRAENDRLRAALAALAAATLPPDAAGALPAEVAAALTEAGWAGAGGAGADAADPAAARRPAPPLPSSAAAASDAVAAADAAYFDSYSGLGIHRDMLSDEPRTRAYRDALEKNPTTVKGKTVLDVGCGTGVLSLFAARGGAAAVVGVDGSATMAALATSVAAANGLARAAGGPVSIVAGRVEDLPSLPGLPPAADGKPVDVIVSEWMGYALFFECMLDAVLAARDRWLKPGGAMLPDLTSIHVAAVDAAADDLAFWRDVHGLDMAPAAAAVRAGRRRCGAVVEVRAAHVLSTSAAVHALDLTVAAAADVAFSTEFRVDVLPAVLSGGGGGAGAPSRRTVGGVALWFDVEFSARACPDHPVLLSTSPAAPPTHWHQALLELDEAVEVGGGGEGAVVAFAGRVSLARAPSHRGVDVSLELAALDGAGRTVSRQAGLYPFVMSSSG